MPHLFFLFFPGIVHKYIRDNYAKRFPELEQLVQEPLDYARTVRVCCPVHAFLVPLHS